MISLQLRSESETNRENRAAWCIPLSLRRAFDEPLSLRSSRLGATGSHASCLVLLPFNVHHLPLN